MGQAPKHAALTCTALVCHKAAVSCHVKQHDIQRLSSLPSGASSPCGRPPNMPPSPAFPKHVTAHTGGLSTIISSSRAVNRLCVQSQDIHHPRQGAAYGEGAAMERSLAVKETLQMSSARGSAVAMRASVSYTALCSCNTAKVGAASSSRDADK